jgi:hypothetical protein
MNAKKHMIWSNMDLNLTEWEEVLRERYEINNLSYDNYDEIDHYNTMRELNDMYLDDERVNLDVDLGRTIIIIADLGLWHGRCTGYKLVKSGNISDCLSDGVCDYREWYVDEKGEMRFTGHHHDGTNFYLYRVAKPTATDDQIDELTSALYCGDAEKAEILIKRHTDRLGDYIGDVYGWKFPYRHKSAMAA